MKTSLKFLALSTATVFPCFANAQFAGAPVPTGANLDAGLAAFAIAMTLLIAWHEYGRALPALRVNESVTLISGANKRSAAHGIRRSAETARLSA
jgi:hypothetical protein